MPSVPGSAHPPPLTAHPHQLGVQDFGSYTLIVDLRSESRFAEDHIPGAVSAPLAAGTTGTRRRPIPDRLRQLVPTLAPGSTLLLYAHAGERVLDASAAWLRGQGLVVDVLPGGWRSYRRWVEASLELLPRMFEFRVLSSSSAGTVAAVLEALRDLGEQVLDLGEAASPSQAAVETKLLHALRQRETGRRLWIVDPATGGTDTKLPPAFREALRVAPRTLLSTQGPGPATKSRPIDMLVVEDTDAGALSQAVERFLTALDRHSKP